MDGAILVGAATDGPMHKPLVNTSCSRQVGVEYIVVFVVNNATWLTTTNYLTWIEMEFVIYYLNTTSLVTIFCCCS